MQTQSKSGRERKGLGRPSGASFLVLGVGSFAHSIGQALKDAGANVSTYLTRNYGHFPPTLVGPTFSRRVSQSVSAHQGARHGLRHSAVH